MSNFNITVIVLEEGSRELKISTTASMLVSDLIRLVANSLNLQPENIRLTFSEVLLVNTQTVGSYNIQEDSSLIMVSYEPSPLKICISSPSGATYIELVHINDTVEMVLKRLGKKVLEVSNMNLIKKTEILNPRTRMWTLGIEEGTTFLLQQKLAGGN